MKKKVVLLALVGLLAMTGVVGAAGLWGTYKGFAKVRVTLNGKPFLTQGVPAVSLQGSAMLPLSALKGLGINYTWDAKKQTVDIKSAAGGSIGVDPIRLADDVIGLGGDGVQLTEVAGEMTAVVYYAALTDLDGDWADIDQIFRKLVPLGAAYMRVVYTDMDEENMIEIKTSDFAKFLNGTITDDQLQQLWITSGPLFDEVEAG